MEKFAGGIECYGNVDTFMFKLIMILKKVFFIYLNIKIL